MQPSSVPEVEKRLLENSKHHNQASQDKCHQAIPAAQRGYRQRPSGFPLWLKGELSQCTEPLMSCRWRRTKSSNSLLRERTGWHQLWLPVGTEICRSDSITWRTWEKLLARLPPWSRGKRSWQQRLLLQGHCQAGCAGLQLPLEPLQLGPLIYWNLH